MKITVDINVVKIFSCKNFDNVNVGGNFPTERVFCVHRKLSGFEIRFLNEFLFTSGASFWWQCKQCLNCEKTLEARRRMRRDERRRRENRGAEGRGMGMGVPLPNRLGVWGSVVSSPSGVRGRAPAENEFGDFCGR